MSPPAAGVLAFCRLPSTVCWFIEGTLLMKRGRGGRPGNRDALKHGFHSRVLSREDILALQQADLLERLDSEIAILRLKTNRPLQRDPDNLNLGSVLQPSLRGFWPPLLLSAKIRQRKTIDFHRLIETESNDFHRGIKTKSNNNESPLSDFGKTKRMNESPSKNTLSLDSFRVEKNFSEASPYGFGLPIKLFRPYNKPFQVNNNRGDR